MAEDDSRKGYRVKLYHLESEGAWMDVGTGNLICIYLEELKAPALVLTSEEDNVTILLKSRIQLEDIYERQGESIIMWRDRLPTGDEDYAVSFQNTGDCQTIWDAIGDVQNQYLQHSEYGIQPNFSKSGSPVGSPMNRHRSISQSQTPSSSSSPSTRLPIVSKENLAELKFLILNTTPFDKDIIVSKLVANDGEYLMQLLALFEELEKQAQIHSLNTLAEIMRAILMLNDSTLIHFALLDAFTTVIGIFEYDPALRYRGNHREFFKNRAKLCEVIPLEDESLKESIHALYKMRYLKDYLLRPSIDETGANALMVMMSSCAITICTKVFMNTEYLTKLFEAIISYSYDSKSITDDPSFSSSSSYNNIRTLGEIVNDYGSRGHSPSNSTCGVDGDDRQSEEDRDDTGEHSNHDVENEDDVNDMNDVIDEKAQDKRQDSDKRNDNSIQSHYRHKDSHESSQNYHEQTLEHRTTNTSTEDSQIIREDDNITTKMISQSSMDTISERSISEKSIATVTIAAPRNIRLEGISFLRELFFLSRNFHWDRRFELYSSFLKRFREPFLKFISDSLNPMIPNKGNPNTQSFENQLLAEVLSNMASVCVEDIRKFIVSGPLPSPPDHVQATNTKYKQRIEIYPTNNTDYGSSGGGDPSNNNTSKNTDNKDEIKSQNCFLYSIIIALIDGDDPAVIEHLSDVIRYLIDPEAIHKPPIDITQQSSLNNNNHSNSNGNSIYNNLNATSNNNENITPHHSSSNILPSTVVSKQEMEKFLGVFYDYYIHWLLVPFVEPNEGHKPRVQSKLSNILLSHSKSSNHLTQISSASNGLAQPYPIYSDDVLSALSVSRRCILEIFTICVYRHAYRMKYFVLRGNLLAKINRFLSSLNQSNSTVSNLRHLQANVVKFWKAIIATKDEFYYRHIVKLDSMSVLIQTLQRELQSLHNQQIAKTIIASPTTKKISRCQESLIASSIVELLLFLSDNSPTLVVYIVDKHLPTLQSEISNSSTATSSFMAVMKHIQESYDYIINPNTVSMNNNNMDDNNAADGSSNRNNNRHTHTQKKRNREFLEQGKEEAYFESMDDDEDEEENENQNENRHQDHRSDYDSSNSNNNSNSNILSSSSGNDSMVSNRSYFSNCSNRQYSLDRNVVDSDYYNSQSNDKSSSINMDQSKVQHGIQSHNQTKDSLQLLADFYADFEGSDDESDSSSHSGSTSEMSSSPTGEISPRFVLGDESLSESLSQKRRRLAEIRDLVDFGVSGSVTHPSMSIPTRVASPPNQSILMNVQPYPMTHISSHNMSMLPPIIGTSAIPSPSVVDHSSNTNGDDEFLKNLPPIKPKFDIDESDLSSEEFFKRSLKYNNNSNASVGIGKQSHSNLNRNNNGISFNTSNLLNSNDNITTTTTSSSRSINSSSNNSNTSTNTTNVTNATNATKGMAKESIFDEIRERDGTLTNKNTISIPRLVKTKSLTDDLSELTSTLTSPSASAIAMNTVSVLRSAMIESDQQDDEDEQDEQDDNRGNEDSDTDSNSDIHGTVTAVLKHQTMNGAAKGLGDVTTNKPISFSLLQKKKKSFN